MFFRRVNKFLFFRDEVDIQEYQELKLEFLDQSKAFSVALERMSVNNQGLKYYDMKQELRRVIATSFNTSDIIKVFGARLQDSLGIQLSSLMEDYKLKRIGKVDMETKRLEILNKIKSENENFISQEDLEFMELKSRQELEQLDSIID